MEIVVKVRRCSGPEDKEIRFDTFKVPQQENMNVLDVVSYIQKILTRAWLFVIHVVLACAGLVPCASTGRIVGPAAPHFRVLRERELIIEPLPHYPIIKDLAVDMISFF
ncbi:MAG: hypothetical protein Ct9H300mP21_02850 [Pseudomonadota bacterium]|nr:MAG: hypothetical protein Ct9H300mP21_02850 [Pseudomonadota bacterium]